MLDDVDRKLLRLWQDQPDLGQGDLARAAGLTPARAARRIARLRQDGILRGLRTQINWTALGYTVEVSLRITLDKTVPRAFDDCITAARAVPEVIEIQTFLGRVDLRLSVIARDMAHYQRLYRDKVLTLPHIADIEALVTVARVKAEDRLPL